MTITPDTLITNTQAVSSAAASNLLALSSALHTFSMATYPLDSSVFEAAQDIAKGDIEVEDVFGPMGDVIRDSVTLSPYPTIQGSAQPVGNVSSTYTDMLSALNEAFPNSDVAKVQSALTALLGSSVDLINQATVVGAVKNAVAANVVASVGALFNDRTPFPAGADSAASSYASSYVNDEIAYGSDIDAAEDYSNQLRLVVSKKRAMAGYISSMLRAKYDVLGSVKDYLDSLSSARRVSVEVSKKSDEMTASEYESMIDVVSATNQLQGAIARGAATYYAAQVSAMSEVNSLKADAVGAASGEFAIVAGIMEDSGVMTSKIARSDSDAAARRAAAAVAALGTVISSAVTGFA